ncbi:unnamed protein product [Parajaminaea phylloscopi]
MAMAPAEPAEGASPVASTSKLPAAPSMPSSTDPRSLTTPAAVRRALAQLDKHSQALDEALDAKIESSMARITISQQSVAALAPQIELLTEEAQVLHSRLVDAAQTSDRISGAVRVLDEERRRIRLASSWVQSVQDLKASLASLASAVDQGEWELATKHAQKAMAVPLDIIESDFAKKVVPSSEQPLSPSQTLDGLRGQLLSVFTRKFKQATEALDQAEASRYFRLFPLVGFRKEGLESYGSFARGMIRGKGKAILEATVTQPSAAHPKLLTALFEQLAILIDTHQPVVDRHYGSGNFALGVMPGLQEECDYIGTRILDSWIEKAAVLRRLDEARAYNFYFLANLGSTGTSQAGKGHSVRGTAAASSKLALAGRPSTPLGSTRPGTPSVGDEQQAPDGRDIDSLLNELALMSARWATYKRFLDGRLASEASPLGGSSLEEHGTGQATEETGTLKDFRRSSIDSAGPESGPVPVQESLHGSPGAAQEIVQSSALGRKLNNLLEDVYCPLERWYLRSSLEKAHRIDTPDLGSRPFTSSVLDDAFFLLRSTLARILSTSHLPTIATAIRSLRATADDDYTQVIVRRLENTWRSVSGSLAGPDGPRKESGTREMRTNYVLYLNILSVSATYAERILADLGSDGHLSSLDPSDEELTGMKERLATLSVLPSRLRSATKSEMELLFNQVTRPRLRLLLSEAFRDMSYALSSDADFADAEYYDVVRRRFVKGWDAVVVAPFKDVFTEENFEAYAALCVENIVRPLEKWIMNSGSTGGTSPWRFTELGALRFDKDWRSIAAHLGGQTPSGEVRDKFARIQQIAYVLSLDEDNDEDVYESGAASGFSWRLTASEVRVVRALRV